MKGVRLYDNLMALPLFLGFSASELSSAVGNTRFDFRKYVDGEIIAAEGDACDQLRFLLQGEMLVISESADRTYRVEEIFSAPEILQPERVFGLRQRFTKTFIAHGTCSMMFLQKREVMRLCEDFELFRLNLLNIVATQAQRNADRLWRIPPQTLERRVVEFFASHCAYPAGKKVIYIKMSRLGEELNVGTRSISCALNKMREKGLLQLSRERVVIPALEYLLM